MLPYLFGSMGMQAVGRAGGTVVIELEDSQKNQGNEKAKPDYGKLVDLLTKAIKDSNTVIVTSFISNSSLFNNFTIGGQVAALSSVGAMLLGVIITGLFTTVSILPIETG